jgi:hypothetical protein
VGPYLAWQGGHGWPELTVAHSIAAGESGTSAPWWLIVPEQFVLVTWCFSPIWVAGLVRFFRDPELRWCRAVGVAYLVLAVAFMLTGGKPYYLATYSRSTEAPPPGPGSQGADCVFTGQALALMGQDRRPRNCLPPGLLWPPGWFVIG